MIDFSKYNLQEIQAVVEVLDWLTDDMSRMSDAMGMPVALAYYGAARTLENALVKQQACDHAAAEAEKVDRIKEACIAGNPPAEDSDDLQSLVDTLSRCSDRLAALALAEGRRFDECGQMDAFIKVTTLSNANRSIINILYDIRYHFKEVLSDD